MPNELEVRAAAQVLTREGVYPPGRAMALARLALEAAETKRVVIVDPKIDGDSVERLPETQ